MSAEHIAGFHAYLLEVANQTMDIGEYVWTHIALNTDAFGEGLLAPLREAVREIVCRPLNDALSDERTKLDAVRDNLWEAGAAMDRVDGEVGDYYRETASFQDE